MSEIGMNYGLIVGFTMLSQNYLRCSYHKVNIKLWGGMILYSDKTLWFILNL